MGYGYISDKQEELGYIDKDSILKYVTEEQIFKLVFGYLPKEMEYVKSPFRIDKTPGCWFEYLDKGLIFTDFTSNTFIDCFGAIQKYFKIPNYYQALRFVYNYFVKEKQLKPVERSKSIYSKSDKDVFKIRPYARNFTNYDKKFWMPYGITREHLMSDGVFPVRRLDLFNTKSGDYSYDLSELCYAYTEFNDGRIKLYYPNSANQRFITNCVNNDIGALDSLPVYGRQLIITKSYKDCRVIRNLGRNSIWLQNEGIIPNRSLMESIVKRFDKVVVLYDNDETGQRQAIKVSHFINSIIQNKSRPLWLPEMLLDNNISDPADLKAIKGLDYLTNFFNDYLL